MRNQSLVTFILLTLLWSQNVLAEVDFETAEQTATIDGIGGSVSQGVKWASRARRLGTRRKRNNKDTQQTGEFVVIDRDRKKKNGSANSNANVDINVNKKKKKSENANSNVDVNINENKKKKPKAPDVEAQTETSVESPVPSAAPTTLQIMTMETDLFLAFETPRLKELPDQDTRDDLLVGTEEFFQSLFDNAYADSDIDVIFLFVIKPSNEAMDTSQPSANFNYYLEFNVEFTYKSEGQAISEEEALSILAATSDEYNRFLRTYVKKIGRFKSTRNIAFGEITGLE